MRRTITTPRRRPTDAPSIYQLNISLIGSEPLIWRRVLVPARYKLNRLHDVIQMAMGWEDDHLYQFVIDGKRYTAWDDDKPYSEVNDRSVRLRDIAPRPGMTFGYEYDFGDGWLHQIEVEAIVPAEPNNQYPRCIGGERSGPPEDCGGIWGYMRSLEAIAHPDDPEYEDVLDWLGEEFDPEAFDLTAVSAQFEAYGTRSAR